MPFDPSDPNSFAANQMTSPLAGMAQDRATGMLNQPQLKQFARPPAAPIVDGGTNFVSPIMPTETQLGMMMPGTLAMAKGGSVQGDELAGIKDTIRAEFAARGLDFDRFVQNPAVMDEVGKSLAAKGQGGDSIVAHINPEEAKLLKEHGGSGTINPATGLPQFEAWSAEGAADDYGGSWSDNSTNYNSSGNNSSMANARALDRASVEGYSADTSGGRTGGDGRSQISLAPNGIGNNPVSMGQEQQTPNQTIGSQATQPGVNQVPEQTSASTLSGLGQLASMPSFAFAAPEVGGTATAQPPIDPVISPVGLSNVDFPKPSPLQNLYNSTEQFGGEEIMSPFVGNSAVMSFPPESQQQMLDALDIKGNIMPAPPSQIRMLETLGITGMPWDGLLPGQQKYQDRAPQEKPVETMLNSGVDFPVTTFGYPEDMRTYGQPRALGLDPMSFIPPAKEQEDKSPQSPIVQAIEQSQKTAPPLAATSFVSPAPRQEPPVESRMTDEQLKSVGIYNEPLKKDETIRSNFNSAYADATANGIDVFQWTNPTTGEVGFYKSEASELLPKIGKDNGILQKLNPLLKPKAELMTPDVANEDTFSKDRFFIGAPVDVNYAYKPEPLYYKNAAHGGQISVLNSMRKK